MTTTPNEQRILARLGYTRAEVTYRLHNEAETDISPDDYLCSTDDPEADAEMVAEIKQRIAAGDEWVWCRVTVVAIWTDPEGNEHTCHEYLGGCSYASEADFKAGGYYTDMCHEAQNGLERQILDELSAGHAKQRKEAVAFLAAQGVGIKPATEVVVLPNGRAAFLSVDAQGRYVLEVGNPPGISIPTRPHRVKMLSKLLTLIQSYK